MARIGVALFVFGLGAGCAGHQDGLRRAEPAPPPSAGREDAPARSARSSVLNEADVEETIDDEVKEREARLKLAQARAGGCGVGLR